MGVGGTMVDDDEAILSIAWGSRRVVNLVIHLYYGVGNRDTLEVGLDGGDARN